jgi:hypothetical protein
VPENSHNRGFLELSQVSSDRDETTPSDLHKQRGCDGAKPERWHHTLTPEFHPVMSLIAFYSTALRASSCFGSLGLAPRNLLVC